jgi:hypothetical protein
MYYHLGYIIYYYLISGIRVNLDSFVIDSKFEDILRYCLLIGFKETSWPQETQREMNNAKERLSLGLPCGDSQYAYDY